MSQVQRAKVSCIPCRRRKSKCDQTVPCASCQLRGTTDQCVVAEASSAASLAYVGPRQSTSSTTDRSRDRDHEVQSRKRVRSYHEEAPELHDNIEQGSALTGSSTSLNNPAVASVTASLMGLANAASAAGAGLSLLDEVANIRTGLDRLSRKLYKAHVAEVNGEADEPVEPIELATWERIRSELPSLLDCEILLEYLMQECDWLCTTVMPNHTRQMWTKVVKQHAISIENAGSLCLMLAIASLFLTTNEHKIYRPSCDVSKLYQPLSAIGLALIDDCLADPLDQEPVLDRVNLVTLGLVYAKFSGAFLRVRPMLDALVGPLKLAGLLDETNVVWENRSEDEREGLRRCMWELIMHDSWACIFHVESEAECIPGADGKSTHPLIDRHPALIPHHIQRPHYENMGLDQPFAVVSRAAYNEETVPMRLFRHKSAAERARATMWGILTMRKLKYITSIVEFCLKVRGDAKQASTIESADRCLELFNDLVAVNDEAQRDLGLNRVPIEDIRADKPQSCMRAAQYLIWLMSNCHVLGFLLQEWGTLKTDRPSESQKRLHQEALKNASRAVSAIPSMMALLSCGHVPFVGAWNAGVLFNSAIVLARPVIRYVHPPPETAGPNVFAAGGGGGSSSSMAPPRPYGGSAMLTAPPPQHIKDKAAQVIEVLHALSRLKQIPLGAEVERHLSELVNKYLLAPPGSRSTDPPSQISLDSILPVPFSPWAPFPPTPSTNGKPTPGAIASMTPQPPHNPALLALSVPGGTMALGSGTDQDMMPSFDNQALQEFLSLDPSIWSELLGQPSSV